MIKKLIKSVSILTVDAPLFFTRVWIGLIFFHSGMGKLQSWDTTLFLFEEEYKVPLLSPYLAAVMGTASEISLSILLIAGIFTRYASGLLFWVNVLAFVSYASVLESRAIGGLDHQLWGLVLLVIACYGGGIFSVDAVVNKVIKKFNLALK